MEYHQQYNQIQPHQQMHPGQSQLPGLSLPETSSSSEKAMMWGGVSQYMPESGYSTQAPSISGSIDPFSNENNQLDSTMSNCGNMDNNSNATVSTVQNDWNYKQNIQTQQQTTATFSQQPVYRFKIMEYIECNLNLFLKFRLQNQLLKIRKQK